MVLAYDASWLGASVAAWVLWRREARAFHDRPATREEVAPALRYGLPRAPAALLAQAIFWVDLWSWPLSNRERTSTPTRPPCESPRCLLFLTSLDLVSPFAADLHARGHRERLDKLFKRSTRWALAATLPLLIVLFVAAGDVLMPSRPGSKSEGALRILLVGQAANVATGSVGFILIMTGFTGSTSRQRTRRRPARGPGCTLTVAFGIEGTATARPLASPR